jgi:N-acyl-D-aspartate/D-glutamate deacylase
MLDLLLRGGTVVDGTGAPARRADVGIRGDRIVAIGQIDEPAQRVIEADGLVIAPGFVDIHTHYDAQVLWDPAASPSPLHGVTTVIGGNCGLSIAPLAPDDSDYVLRMMAVVEGLPEAALRSVAWNWTTFAEYLDRLEGRLGVNAGFLVGHSTLRRAAMGTAGVSEPASDDQLELMKRMLGEALDAGALGLSSSRDEAHTDGDGHLLPARAATHEELIELSKVVGSHEGTTLEFIPAIGEIPSERMDLMAEMSLAANRPLNWNLLGSLSPVEIYEQQLVSSDVAAARGAKVVALALPDLMRMRANAMLDLQPGFRELGQMSEADRRAALADPATRDQLRTALAKAVENGISVLGRFDLIEIAEGRSPETAPYVGRTLASIADERGVDPVDVLLDVVLPEQLPLTILFPSLVPSLGTSDESWEARAKVWLDDRVVLGGSDAGAHLDLMCHANYTTMVLSEVVRQRGLMSIEEAVRQLTDVPARLYGLRDRGRVAEGWYADLVVFDPARVGSHPAASRFDLPGDLERLYAESTGVEHVLVGGREVVRSGELTGELAGTLLRSGRDTETVTLG